MIENRHLPIVNMVFRRDRNSDRRRYNLPTVEEVAMIFTNKDGEPPFERDFRVFPRNDNSPVIKLQNSGYRLQLHLHIV